MTGKLQTASEILSAHRIERLELPEGFGKAFSHSLNVSLDEHRKKALGVANFPIIKKRTQPPKMGREGEQVRLNSRRRNSSSARRATRLGERPAATSIELGPWRDQEGSRSAVGRLSDLGACTPRNQSVTFASIRTSPRL